ncbi:MAG: thiamine phosphate synthase [Candidatus Omnitrophica bacterium]|nr:thiamine phosphate synthase [Candidatus Omnitrophota bacterium]
MRWNVRSCSDWRLYVIVDRAAVGPRGLEEVAAAAIRGGADVLQLRDKAASARRLLDAARALLALTRPAGIPLIINDRVDVAASAGADGVHLGQDDLPLPEARRLLGPGRVIGQSTHSLEQTVAAEAAGADYLGLGPIFPTPTKPESGSIGTALISAVTSRVRVPVVCIGGIDGGNVARVLEAGATRVAVVRAVCAAADPAAAARDLKERLEQFARSARPS